MPDNAKKVNVLLQAYLSRVESTSFSLTSDTQYLSQNIIRVLRALFEIALGCGWSSALVILTLCKSFEKRMWPFQTPLIQFSVHPKLPPGSKGIYKGPVLIPFQYVSQTSALSDMEISCLESMNETEIGELVKLPRLGPVIKECIRYIPSVKVLPRKYPITKNILRLDIEIVPDFEWSVKFHEKHESFYIVVQSGEIIYASSKFFLEKGKNAVVQFYVPVFEDITVIAASDSWVCDDTVVGNIRAEMPDSLNIYTKYLELVPLMERNYLNPMQTQLYHLLFHTNRNILLGAPTFSGKHFLLDMFIQEKKNILYICESKWTAKERLERNKEKGLTCWCFGISTEPITDDHNLIICTNLEFCWENKLQRKVLIIDGVEMIRKNVFLEGIVQENLKKRDVRIIGISSVMSCVNDMGDWLSVSLKDRFFFGHSDQSPEIHIDGFPHRNSDISKTIMESILQYSPSCTVMVVVFDRKRLFSLLNKLVAICAQWNKRFLKMSGEEIYGITECITHKDLRTSLSYGIGAICGSITQKDQDFSREMFSTGKLQILFVNGRDKSFEEFTSHLTIVDTLMLDNSWDIIDTLRPLRNAGSYFRKGVGHLMCRNDMKGVLRTFIYEPFTIETKFSVKKFKKILDRVGGGFDTFKDFYYSRRLVTNPVYYGTNVRSINRFLSEKYDECVDGENNKETKQHEMGTW